MDLEKYLSRIGYTGPAEPSLDVLRSVHLCHLRSVPFENLTVHSGGRVQLDLQLIYEKIVNQRRGGFCYENNGLFSWLLGQLGFPVTMLACQVKTVFAGQFGPPFDHMILMVRAEGQRWLCDVGMGVPGFSSPLSLETSAPQVDGHRVYRIREQAEMRFVEWQREENRGPDGDWLDLCKFTLEPRCLEDFEGMSQFHQSSPCSILFCKSLCSVLKPGGRLTYLGRRLTSTTFPSEGTGEAVEITTKELRDEEIPGILAHQFGIVLNDPLTPKDEPVEPSPEMY